MLTLLTRGDNDARLCEAPWLCRRGSVFVAGRGSGASPAPLSGPGLGSPPRLGYPPRPVAWARHPEGGRPVSEGLLESARAGRDEQFGSGENARSADAGLAARE